MLNKYKLATLAVLATAASFAQSAPPTQVSVSTSDETAATQASGRQSHGRRANSQTARAFSASALSSSRSAISSGSSGSGSNKNMTRFAGDLSYNGGPVITYAQSHAIYLNPVSAGFPNGSCTIVTCWGDPEGFLRDLGSSEFIHITDQYVNLKTDNRYTVGQSAMVNYSPSFFPLSDNDILAKVHAVAVATGQSGYSHIYHVFLPPGQDVCQLGGICASNAICAYHGSADFFDIGHVVYSVEPDQIGFGCSLGAGTPNGARTDSTNNVLSHELFEIITDPDFDAWFNSSTLDLLFEEIGDECSFLTPDFSAFDVPTFKIGKNLYAVQREYDNNGHVCGTKPY